MKVDFFKASCQTITQETKFGICDDDDKNIKTPAYINTDDASKWIAEVLNESSKTITFTAIDNCIDMIRENGDMEKRCDGMITCEESLFLVELKDKTAHWQSSGIEQIESTLIQLIENNEKYYYGFKRRKAFVANKRHPQFQVVENAVMRRFSTQYKIWLDLRGTIEIK
jgi:hypothetical protein